MITKFGKCHQIRIVEASGINGSVLATIDSCYHRVRGKGKNLHLPGNNMTDILIHHFSENTVVAYMTNSPGELTGKLTNHVIKHYSFIFIIKLIINYYY